MGLNWDNMTQFLSHFDWEKNLSDMLFEPRGTYVYTLRKLYQYFIL